MESDIANQTLPTWWDTNSKCSLPYSEQHRRRRLCFCSFPAAALLWSSWSFICASRVHGSGKNLKWIYSQTLGFLSAAPSFLRLSTIPPQFPAALAAPDSIIWQDKPLQPYAPVLAAPCHVGQGMLSGDMLYKHELQSVWFPSLKRQTASNVYLTLVIFPGPSNS